MSAGLARPMWRQTRETDTCALGREGGRVVLGRIPLPVQRAVLQVVTGGLDQMTKGPVRMDQALVWLPRLDSNQQPCD